MTDLRETIADLEEQLQSERIARWEVADSVEKRRADAAEATIAKLEADLDEQLEWVRVLAIDVSNHEATIAKLRKALQDIVYYSRSDYAKDTARAALAQTKGETDEPQG